MLDEEAYISKVRYLCGKHGRRCGRYKREGMCALPGEVCLDEQAEVSRSHSKHGVVLC